MPLRNVTIKNKVTLLLMMTSGTAVGLVCLMFYFLVAQSFQKNYHTDLNNLVEIVGSNCTAALLFNVPEDAEAILDSFKNRSSILSVRLYDRKHNLFASYDKSPSVVDPHKATLLSRLEPEKSVKIEWPITLQNGTIAGRIIVYDDIRGIGISNKKWIIILSSAGFIAMIAAFFLARLLQNIISRPLLTLTNAVQKLASGDFEAGHDIRVNSYDEIGQLSTAFINMNRKLQNSYAELEAYNQNLEQRVALRTEELQKAVSDLTKSQAQLIQSEKMVAVGHLVAGVAHEINNSLNFISGAIPAVAMLTKKISQQLGDEAKQTQPDFSNIKQIISKIETLLSNAETGVQRTAKIVSDLNTFARPNQGHFQPTDIRQEIEMIITLLHYDLRNRIEVVTDFSADLPLVSCLRDQMNQVYMNILRNAIHAISDKGTIWIKTAIDGEMAVISFRDSGCGIPDSAKTQIFNPFFSTKKVGEGTGLGLSISYGIIRNHHGEITVDSTLNQGTTITLHLPITTKTKQQTSSGDTNNLLTADNPAENT
ncbi:MAG: ATP-binding protein [Desulfobulbaceae bacterium]|nr:ATP-binding protein [Desulfobulbaceae bacterium]